MDIFSEFTNRLTLNVSLLVVAVLSTGYIGFRLVASDSVQDKRKYAPSVGSLPIIGSLPFLPNFHQLHRWSLDKSYTLGGVLSFKVGNQYTVLLNSHELIREAFVQRSLDFAGRIKHFIDDIWNPNGKGLLFHTYDEEFKKYHQMSLTILKQFGFGKNIMGTRISMEVGGLIDNVKAMNSQAFDPKQFVLHAVYSVISRIVFSLPMDASDLVDNRIIELVLKLPDQFTDMMTLDVLPSLRFLPYFRKRRNQIKQYTEELFDLIDQKIDQTLLADEEDSFVSWFVKEEGSAFDRDQLKITIRDLLAAGTDTVAATMSWAFVLLANHPVAQERLQQAIDQLVPRDRLPEMTDFPKMNYLEATILEIMRCKTTVVFGMPHITLRDTEVGGFFVPKNSQVFAMLYAIHMDVNVWTDPEEFRPERFLDSGGNIINKDLVMPFSIGKRSCLGESMARQEVFLFLSGLVQQFNILPPEGSEKIEYKEHMCSVMCPQPYKARFIPRN